MRKLALATVATALATSPAFAFKCPAKGGARWREYRTAHFVIDSDFDHEAAGTLVKQFEQMHALLLQGLVGEQVDIPGHVRVIAFDSPRDFAEFAGGGVDGYYTRALFGEPTIVLYLTGFRDHPEIIAHELAHHLSFFLFPVQPRWYSEGLAEFVENVMSGGTDNAPVTGSHMVLGSRTAGGGVGIAPAMLGGMLEYDRRPVAAKDLLAWKGQEDKANAFRYHLWSWILYHYLWNNRGKQLSDYQKRLSDSGDPEAAWAGAFPDLNPANSSAMEALDKQLQKYGSEGRYAFYRVQASPNARFTEAPLAAADLHLYLTAARRGPQDDAERKAANKAALEEALGEDAGHPMVLSRLGADEARVRAAALARPSDWRSWLVLSGLDKGEAKIASLRKAIELNPDSAYTLNNLAWELAMAGKPQEALPIANRAVDLAPWSGGLIDTLAEVAYRLGKCREALVLSHRAYVAEGKTDAAQKRNAEFESRCARPPVR
jgi:tetratricopeptide (TPR) repeat protein